ncbi:MAG: HD domain-containing protein [Chloroflexi bacterium]|nr:HD domain-containing protein [Chloroflexota bacterium]
MKRKSAERGQSRTSGQGRDVLEKTLRSLWSLAEPELKRRQDGHWHTLEVVENARKLVAQEGGDRRVALAAAMLHDVGIPEALAKYSSADGPYQQKEGEAIARRFLLQLGWDEIEREAICYIVAHHHERPSTPSLEFRVVWDADALVNEDFSNPARQEETLATFYTATGREMARVKFQARTG